MGKILVINGADFSANALAEVTPTYNVPTKKTKFGVQYMELDDLTAIRALVPTSSAAPISKLIVADVSAFIGKTAVITTYHPVVANGAKYCAFASNLGTLTFDDIPDLEAVPNPAGATHYEVDVVGESFNVAVEDGKSNTVTKIIPNGAKYLLITLRTNGDLAEKDAGVFVELE